MSSWLFLQSAKRFEKLAIQAMRQQSLHVRIDKRNMRTLTKIQNSPAAYDVLSYLRQLCSKPPKGFEKFFKDKPSGGGNAAKKSSESAKPPPSKSASSSRGQSAKKDPSKNDISDFFKITASGGSGGGGAGGFGQDPNNQKIASMVGLGVMGVLAMIAMNQMKYR